MSCCDPCGPYPEDTVEKCPDCDGEIDKDGEPLE